MQITPTQSAGKSLSQVAMHYPLWNYATCIKTLGAGVKLLLMSDADPQHQEGRGFYRTIRAPEAPGLQFQQSW